MKKLKEELKYGKKGITLISLVVTIIVLLILAGITINMLFGDNGLLNRANSSKEIYNKASVEEEVKIVLNDYEIGKYTGESYELKEFLENELSVTVTASGNNLDFIYKGYLFTINKNNLEILIMEKFNIAVSKIFESVADMKKDTELTENIYVKTLGYYNSTFGGGAYYQIVNEDLSSQADNMMIISLDNGLFAKYITIGNMITVKQMGAYGDGIHDDRRSIQTASNNLDGGTLYFENGTYKISTKINIDRTINLIGESKEESILEATEGYALWDNIIEISNTEDIIIENLTFDGYSEVNKRGEIYQLGSTYQLLRLENSNNISIENCIFKDNVGSSILLNNGCENFKINSCELINVDCGVILMNYEQDKKYTNYIFTNNTFNGHEYSEPISFYTYGNFSNITISNNTFNDKYLGNGILFDTKTTCSNILIENNNFYGQSAMHINSSYTENIKISNNYFTRVPESHHAITINSNISNAEISNNTFEEIYGNILNVGNNTEINTLTINNNTFNLMKTSQILFRNVSGDNLKICDNEFLYSGNTEIFAFTLRDLSINNINITNNKYSSISLKKWIDNSTCNLYAKEDEGGSFTIVTGGEYKYISAPYEFTESVLP